MLSDLLFQPFCWLTFSHWTTNSANFGHTSHTNGKQGTAALFASQKPGCLQWFQTQPSSSRGSPCIARTERKSSQGKAEVGTSFSISTIRIYPNQKPWINSNVRSALSAFKSGNTDNRKQASYNLRRSIKAAKRQYKNKVEEQFNNNNARSMFQGINNITGFKGNKPATVNIAASLPDELNTFYASFEADNTAHTESAPAAAEVSPLSLSVADITRSFKRVNIRKAVGPDGISGRVLRACAFQLAGFFTDIFNLSLSLSVVPACFKKNLPLCPYQRKIKSHA